MSIIEISATKLAKHLVDGKFGWEGEITQRACKLVDKIYKHW